MNTESLFSAEFLAEMKERLEADMAQLEEKLAQFSSKSPATTEQPDGTFPEYGDEEEDNIHEMEEYEVNLSLKSGFEKQLRDVRNALTRMEEGTYGICKYTGKKIDERRLRARPTSSSSMEAKEALQSGKIL